MNSYIAGFNGKKIEIKAASLYLAKEAALKAFNPTKSKRGQVWVELVELANGKEIITHVD